MKKILRLSLSWLGLCGYAHGSHRPGSGFPLDLFNDSQGTCKRAFSSENSTTPNQGVQELGGTVSGANGILTIFVEAGYILMNDTIQIYGSDQRKSFTNITVRGPDCKSNPAGAGGNLTVGLTEAYNLFHQLDHRLSDVVAKSNHSTQLGRRSDDPGRVAAIAQFLDGFREFMTGFRGYIDQLNDYHQALLQYGMLNLVMYGIALPLDIAQQSRNDGRFLNVAYAMQIEETHMVYTILIPLVFRFVVRVLLAEEPQYTMSAIREFTHYYSILWRYISSLWTVRLVDADGERALRQKDTKMSAYIRALDHPAFSRAALDEYASSPENQDLDEFIDAAVKPAKNNPIFQRVFARLGRLMDPHSEDLKLQDGQICGSSPDRTSAPQLPALPDEAKADESEETPGQLVLLPSKDRYRTGLVGDQAGQEPPNSSLRAAPHVRRAASPYSRDWENKTAPIDEPPADPPESAPANTTQEAAGAEATAPAAADPQDSPLSISDLGYLHELEVELDAMAAEPDLRGGAGAEAQRVEEMLALLEAPPFGPLDVAGPPTDTDSSDSGELGLFIDTFARWEGSSQGGPGSQGNAGACEDAASHEDGPAQVETSSRPLRTFRA